jgi:small conductance mechanosensitive channel
VRDVEGTLYIIPNSQIATVANLSARPSVATVLVSVDFSANPDEVCKLLTTIALEIRHEERFAALFTDDPQTPGLDQIKGSEMLFPVIFKTHPGKQYEPVREFKRRVRLALEERKMLPGDSMRVFSGFDEAGAETGRRGRLTEAEVHDPTAQKPPAGSLFGGE